MPVISFVSPKGGAGKSTSALLLATQLADKGASVTVIDCDPEQWITQWGQGGYTPETMTILPNPGQDDITDAIDDASRSSAFVIVDTEGTANMTGAWAVGRSDFVIIPTQPSTMDGKSAGKAIRLIKQQEKQINRTIPYAVLLTRTSAVIQSKLQRSLTEQLAKSDVPVFQTELLERSAYKSIFDRSCTLRDLPKNTYKLADAIANAQAFAGEVVSMFKTQQPKERKEVAA